MDLQGTSFSLTLYFLPLTRLDVVLGIQWLKLHGSMVCDWKHLIMEVLLENQARRLLGIDRQDIQVASLKEFSEEICPNQALFALYFQVTQMEPQGNIHLSMQEILQEFSDLFTKPMSLPPTRKVDHDITLKERTEPINVHPYRYGHY